MMFDDEIFMRGVKEHNITDPFEILNWYRNLYHAEDNHTEHGIMAYAINDVFMEYKNVVSKVIVNQIFEDIFLCANRIRDGELVINHSDVVKIKNKFQRRLNL